MTPGKLGVIFYFKPINSLYYEYTLNFCVRDFNDKTSISRTS